MPDIEHHKLPSQMNGNIYKGTVGTISLLDKNHSSEKQPTMTENKLYAQCREEALKQISTDKNREGKFMKFTNDELQQLTAEIYGMKLLDMLEQDKKFYMMTKTDNWIQWILNDGFTNIGTTQDLHDHFVREFNVSLTNEGNNGKQ